VEAVMSIKTCAMCDLRKKAIQVVVGEGPINAQVMFVGEAPGKQEDETGLPFVGVSGRYMTEVMEQCGLPRDTVYVTNIVKCRPVGNADPTPQQVKSCRPNLDVQHAIIQPKIVVPVGRFAMNEFLPGKLSITEVNGTVFDYYDRKVIPLIHPAFVLRKRDIAGPEFERAMRVIAKEAKLVTLEKQKQRRKKRRGSKRSDLFF